MLRRPFLHPRVAAIATRALGKYGGRVGGREGTTMTRSSQVTTLLVGERPIDCVSSRRLFFETGRTRPMIIKPRTACFIKGRAGRLREQLMLIQRDSAPGKMLAIGSKARLAKAADVAKRPLRVVGLRTRMAVRLGTPMCEYCALCAHNPMPRNT
jgi:hypothetical protein